MCACVYQRRASRSAYHAGSGRMVKPISLPSFFFPFSVSSHFRWRQRTVGHLGFTFQPIARLQTKTGQWRARLRPPTRESPQSSTPPPSSGKNLLDRNEEKRKKKKEWRAAQLFPYCLLFQGSISFLPASSQSRKFPPRGTKYINIK